MRASQFNCFGRRCNQSNSHIIIRSHAPQLPCSTLLSNCTMAIVPSSALQFVNSSPALHSRKPLHFNNIVALPRESFPIAPRIGGHRLEAGSSSRRSSFLGCEVHRERELDARPLLHKSVAVARCSVWSRGRGRMFFVPFGRARHGSTFARHRHEWEKRSRAQQERLREMIERELNQRHGEERNSVDSSLLRELEKRLRAEEASLKQDRSAQEASGAEAEEAEEGASTPGSDASTYELLKELEKRLRAEREKARRETRESPRRREDLKTANYASLYDYLKEWDKGIREERNILEEQWKAREGSRDEKRNENRERPRNGERSEFRQRWQQEGGHARHWHRKHNETEEDKPRDAAPQYAQTNETVVYLKNEANGAEIYLVGTSHVSQKSADEVREVIERVKPDFVLVELCRKRYESMHRKSSDQNNSRRDSPLAFVEEMVRMLTAGDVGPVGKLVGFGLAAFYRLLSYQGYHPGQEFQVAIDEGKKLGAKIVLGDQDIDTTLKNLGNFDLNMSIQDAFRLFGQRMPADIANSLGKKSTYSNDMFEGMRDRKVVRHFNEEMEKGAPRIFKVMVTDRNEIMMKALRNLNGKVVAVVGLAHVDGMEQLWHKANEKYISNLSNQTES